MAYSSGFHENQKPSMSFARERTRILGSDTVESLGPTRRHMSSDPVLVVAIDFGTTYSGYAFSFKHEKEHIHLNQWSEAGITGQMKTPTCLLLHPDKTVHSFGNEAKEHYGTLTGLREHQNWYFFWEFKMSLHSSEEIKGNYLIKEEGGKRLDAHTVFSLSIKWLKDHLMTMILNYQAGLKDEHIKWILTVPAIWKDSAKKFMREAAEKAGIKSSNLDLALEPEAAALFWQRLQFTRERSQFTREPSQIQTDFQRFPVGTKYLLLDCGGGTVDVTAHEVLADGKLKELHRANGGNWGGKKVNESFIKNISRMVGDRNFRKFRDEYKSEYMELLAELENKKRHVKPGSDDPVTIRIPFQLQDTLRGRVNMVGDKLRIENNQFEYFFQNASSQIVNHTRELLEFIPGPIKYILMVGGFSDSPVLQKYMKDAFIENRWLVSWMGKVYRARRRNFIR